MSPITSTIVIVVILALVGTVAYGVMGGFSSAPGSTCQPASSPGCGSYSNFHDVRLILPFKSAQTGAPLQFTANLPSGESATKYTYDFGDGSQPNVTLSPTITHAYLTPGVYLVLVQAVVAGAIHDNAQNLVQIQINAAAASANSGNLPDIQGAVISNTSASPGGPAPTAVLQPGDSVTLGASYTSAPTNPAWREVSPVITVPTGAAVVSNYSSPVNATDTLTFRTPGTYVVNWVAGATNLTTSAPTSYTNFTWTVYVPPTGVHAGVVGLATPESPHPGVIISYELAPGGAHTEDPAIAYDTVSYEPILNIYQPLVTYNGSDVGPTWSSFLPALATCVPGSPQCQSLYHSTLINGYNYTFVINGASQFYDATTTAHWGVYPSDVVFSVARTLGFSTLPSVTSNNGWILAQSLLGRGNGSWSTIHQAYNNTPQQILGSMVVNDTADGFCPQAAMTNDHGCVTFRADGNGLSWPYFLELLADPLGGSIVPCGWFSAASQGAGIPYWTSGNSSGAGDHPCQMPGQGGYGVPASQIPFTGWDQWEEIGSGATGRYAGKVQYSMVGSGPYYLSEYSVGISYALAANPAYVQNPYCTWKECPPAPNAYAKTVEVTWEADATEGEQALSAGVADFASVPSSDLSLLLQLISQGKLNAISNPTLNIGFDVFDMDFNVAGAQSYSTQPITVQSDWFAHLGMRQFMAHSYPYATVEQTINTKDGIVLGFNYGGAIPQYMGNYYPTNISWPSGDPCTDSSNPSCAAYWWSQMHDPSSPYYDSEVLSCSATNPCEFPYFGQTGNAVGDEVTSIWAGWISQLTGGAIKMDNIDINFVNEVINSEASPGSNPMPIYGLGWAPDYPDPTDYVTPLYLENASYTYSGAFAQSLYVAQYGGPSCQAPTNYMYYVHLTSPVPQSCQGPAYKAMIKVLGIAAQMPAGPSRVAEYAMAEQIANQLSLYVYTSQSNGFGAAGAWIDISSLNTNPTMGAGGDTPFFWLTGHGVAG
jgi:hypothetical protein